MTIRSLNYTGRSRITLDRIKLTLSESDGALRIVGHVDLEGLDVEDARLVIELYRSPQKVRLDLGPAAGLVAVDGSVEAFAPATGILCHVLVLSTTDDDFGKIKAAARSIRPEVLGEDSGRNGLLDFLRNDDLGELIWRFDTSNDKPEVHINGKVEDWKGLARSEEFRLLVLPQVAREAARWVASKRADIKSGGHELAIQWAVFFQSVGCDVSELEESDDDQVEAWVDRAAERFAARHKFMNKWLARTEGGSA